MMWMSRWDNNYILKSCGYNYLSIVFVLKRSRENRVPLQGAHGEPQAEQEGDQGQEVQSQGIDRDDGHSRSVQCLQGAIQRHSCHPQKQSLSQDEESHRRPRSEVHHQ